MPRIRIRTASRGVSRTSSASGTDRPVGLRIDFGWWVVDCVHRGGREVEGTGAVGGGVD